MDIDFTLHGSADQQRMRAALDMGRTNNAARTQDAPASANVRTQIAARLGLTENASDAQIFTALDSNLAAAKAKRTQIDPAAALYNAAWGDSTSTQTPTASPVDAALYELAFGKPMGA